jgi:hypothetical protein
MKNKKFIHCSFQEKEAVKKLGAHWDNENKSWYIPDGLSEEPFAKWLVTGKGEAGIGGLYVDLVPQTCWFSNIRSALSKSDWDLIRKKIYNDSNHRCEICHGYGDQHPVEAHERWGFDWDTKTQKLTKIESLCPDCHQATHFGFAIVSGKEEYAFKRLKYVNGWNDKQTNNHIEEAFKVWDKRNLVSNWKLDISWLNSYIELDSETQKLIADLKQGKVAR